MRKQFRRSLSLVLVLFLLVGSVVPVMAATYRPGAQSGPSSSYANGMYYSNYKRVPITGDNRTDLIAIALSQLGYQEGASNGSFSGQVSGRANYVEFSYNLGDLGLGYGGTDYPWCASFVTWCLYQSHCTNQATYKDLGRFHNGDYKYIWKEISCSQWVRQLKGAGYYRYSAYQGGSYTPKSGDLVFFQNSGGVAHIGICLYTSGGRIYTVEGNTSDSAGLEPNGGGVYFKNYSLSTSYINGYGVLPYVSKSSVTKIDYSGNNPTPGLYVANASKYIYASETASSHSWVMDRFTMFEVTQVCSNGRLKVTAKERGGSTVTGYVSNNSDRVIPLSTTASDGTAAARTVLQGVVKEAQKLRHYNYTEETITQIRTAYKEAVALVANSAATEAQLVASAATLRNLMGTTGINTIAQNNQGIYINGRNGVIQAGDCFIYSPTWNNGLITVENANIRYTLNVVCAWDAERQINVVKSITQGKGSATPAIQLGEAEFLIACHDWETGVGSGDDPVEYSGTNYKILSSLSIGDGVKLSGATALNANTDVEPAAYLKFTPKNAVQIASENVYVENGCAVLFTPDFQGGVINSTNAGISRTLNLLAQWDNANSAWVVTDKFTGASSDVTITDGQILLACHAGDTTGQAYNYSMFTAAKVGQQLVFSGISPTDGSVRRSISANISFKDLITPEPDGTIETFNLSQGLGTTLREPGSAAHKANLTDGVYVDALNTTGGWFGFLNVTESANCNTDETGVGSVTIDLGAHHRIETLRMHLFAGENAASIGQPLFVDVYTSNNGSDFAYAGSLNLNADATSSYWAELGNAGVGARFVRFLVGPPMDASWVFLNEVEVWGTELTGEENMALGTAQVTTGAEGYTGNLTDGIIGEAGDAATWYGIDTTAGSGSGVIDLGGRYQITGVQAHVYAAADFAAPALISVSTSADGSNYMKIGELPLDADAAESYWASISTDASVGQYVKLTAENEAGLALLSELQVYGVPYVSSADSNIAMGKDTVVAGYEGSPFTALLNDGLASEVFQYNVNNAAWFAFKNPDNVTISNDTTGEGRGIITIDLGGQAEITNLNIHVFGGTNDAGAVQPDYINTYYSTDGASFEYRDTINPDTTQEGAYWMSADYSASPVTARYVKLAVGTGSGDLVLLNEIKIGGLMLSLEEPNEPGSLSSVVLTGDFNNWNPTPNMLVVDDQKVTTTMTLEAGSYQFKVLFNGEWFGNNGTIYDTTGETPWVMDTTSGNCIINASRTGDYVFTFDRDTKELVVAYIPDTLYLRGSFNDWGTIQPMTDNGDNTYSTTIALAAGTHEFKVANEDYTGQWPTNNYVLNLDRAANVTVTLDSRSNTLTVSTAGTEAIVTFVNWDGTVPSTQNVKLGELPVAPENPVRESDGSYSYTFLGWDKEISAAAGDVTYTAVYEAVSLAVAPTIALKYPTLVFEDEILMNVYYAASNLEDVAEMGLITYSENVAEYGVETAEHVIPGYAWSDADQFYYSTTSGIAAKCLGDTIYFAVYWKLTDGTYGYTKLAGYSPKTYAYNQLKTGSADMKPIVVAMLKYGAAAQSYFSYNLDNLVDANLTDDQTALVEAYRSDMMGAVVQASGDKLGEMVKTGGYLKRYPTISFEGAFCINYYFQPSAVPAGDITMYIWNLSDFNAAESLSKANATYALTMEPAGEEYLAIVEGIAAKDLDRGIYVSFCYSDGTTEYCSGVIGYSIGMYCTTQASKTGTLADLAAATAVYGYYARELFYK